MMAERVRQVVKQGTWLYDGTVPCEVEVIKSNYFERPEPDEDKVPGYPPRDADGNFYFVRLTLKGIARGVFKCFGSSDEAVQGVMKKLVGPIHWLPDEDSR